jgi:competence protein ComEA
MEQLDVLPGVGPVTAQRILDWRAAHGRFTSVDQLREVDGIGPARLARLKDLVRV